VLRAGTERGWGVALVCGAGMNCVGVAPDGRQARFPALGAITGDWGGGADVGLAGLEAAARAEDGRGPRTSLEHAVPAHFGLDTPRQVGEAIHLHGLERGRLVELAPIVLRESERDAVAAGIVERLIGEAVALVRVALERLDLIGEPADVVLGGGLVRDGGARLAERIAAQLAAASPAAAVRVVSDPPIVGAALLALDALGADHDARDRARGELSAEVERQETMVHG
jgi:N-acetylglucosamine kinase-like BadF-type ATPase